MYARHAKYTKFLIRPLSNIFRSSPNRFPGLAPRVIRHQCLRHQISCSGQYKYFFVHTDTGAAGGGRGDPRSFARVVLQGVYQQDDLRVGSRAISLIGGGTWYEGIRRIVIGMQLSECFFTIILLPANPSNGYFLIGVPRSTNPSPPELSEKRQTPSQ